MQKSRKRAGLLVTTLAAMVLLSGCSDTAVGTASPPSPTAEPSGSGEASATASAARAGLANWLQENRPETPRTSTDIAGCPLIDLGTVQAALAPLAIDELKDWGTEIEWDEYSELHPDLMGVICGADSDGDTHDSNFGHAVSITAIDLAGHATFDDLIDLYDLQTLEALPATTPGPAASAAAGTCQELGCLVLLDLGDNLVIGAFLINIDEADEATALTVLHTIGPDMLATMAQL